MTPANKTIALLGAAATITGAALALTVVGSASEAAVAPLPPPVQSSDFKVSAGLESSHLLYGRGEAHMAVTVSAPDVDGDTARPPINVAVVLDRSGSMAGRKLEQAKLAADRLVGSLRSQDRFSIIAYGSDVDVIYPLANATETNIAAAQRSILQIYDDGGTNLSGGLIAGAQQLQVERGTRTVSRIVLISDGIANEGITEPNALVRLADDTTHGGTSVTTIGVGLDFDERLMTRMAVAGRGNYYFVDEGQDLRNMFATELGHIGSTVATDVMLSIQPQPGVEVIEAYGYNISHKGANGSVVIPVADLRSGETRKVVLRLALSGSRVGAIDLANVAVNLWPTDTDQPETINTLASAVITRDEKQYRKGRDKTVVRNIEAARTAAAVNRATELYEQGNQAQAVQLLQARKQQAVGIANEMKDKRMADQLGGIAEEAEADFARAPEPSSTAGKRARKSMRNKSYQMLK